MDLNKTMENLRKRGYTVSHFATGEQAAQHLCSTLEDCVIGFGGSMTVRQLGLFERLGKRNTVFWHWQQDFEQACAGAASHARVYICSVNGLAETGELINIDGHGNRLAATVYGKDKVIFVVGVNKIAPDYDSALWRARNIASPMNARRLGKDTPCAKGELRCYDCASPERICRALMVFWEKPTSIKECEVVLVDESLGF